MCQRGQGEEHGEGPKGGYYRNTSYKKAPQRQVDVSSVYLFVHYLAQKRCSIKSVEDRQKEKGRRGETEAGYDMKHSRRPIQRG